MDQDKTISTAIFEVSHLINKTLILLKAVSLQKIEEKKVKKKFKSCQFFYQEVVKWYKTVNVPLVLHLCVPMQWRVTYPEIMEVENAEMELVTWPGWSV